jgi:hypothetical protein
MEVTGKGLRTGEGGGFGKEKCPSGDEWLFLLKEYTVL